MSTESPLTLYDYWRSSACYRVRIALNLKGLAYAQKPVHLVRDGGEQHGAAYRELNPQEVIPALVDGQRVIRQSLAIIEYLEEARLGTPALLPANARDRAHVRSLALLVACDIHPLNNLRVMQYLERELGMEQATRERWTRHWMQEGFRAFEAILAADSATGPFCHGDLPTLADACLIPQVYNANRFGVDMTPYPIIRRINEHCLALPAFDAARPEKQPDAA
ncbi:MAG: maleylacetoacetate isomerase [Rhodanobacteraceae bacterium]|jgi:maleylacetoacetate isomerase|nr:maleylacetoacetate isomerase [Rhodanobacteraceae bacterium]